MNRRQLLLRVQLVLLGLLLAIWWITRPPAGTAPAPLPQQASPKAQFEPAGISRNIWNSGNIDLSKPECVKLRDEIMKQMSEGSTLNVFHIGDCDKRLQYQ